MKKVSTLLMALIIIHFANAQKTAKVTFSGSWKLVSVENINPDNSKTYPYGTDPKGFLFFDEKGNYGIQIYKNERQKVVSGDKNKCTPEENASIVQGCNSHFGKYEIDETKKILSFKIQTASFPNWENTQQNRSYIFINDELQYEVTNTTQGGKSVTAIVVWKKL